MYSENLADRVRDVLADRGDAVEERKMFGGLAFMVGGQMAVGVVGDALMVRLGADATQAALSRPHVRPMDFTGKVMRTMVFVDPAGLRGRALRGWIDQALAHVATLRPKTPLRRSGRA